MASVDDRVVQMTFDNALFERRMADTIKSLDALNKTLQLTEGTKGLKDIDAAAKEIDMTSVSRGIEGVSKTFLALSTIGITVLSNIATKAFETGTRIVKSLSIDQVISGFQEYETNMKSIQTILANTKADGTNLGQVNDALDELNSYADLTIYNFAEMARNIGTFTAAGVDLDTSVASIKGIANAAAISGSTSQQASTAMYQLSQAIASGSLKLMDWNSVVNAGMGGEVMQRALFTTGKAMGTLVDVPIDQTFDDWKDSGNSFRESLQDGWITTEVLTTTLKGFSGEATAAELAAAGFTDTMIAEFNELGETGIEAATKVRTFTQLMDTAQEAVGSGWSQTFRIVLGDFEEATELFTGISEAFGSWADASADARNSLLQDWKDLGGRAAIIDGLKELFYGLGRIIGTVKQAFRDVFPPITGERLAELSKSFSELMTRFVEATNAVLPDLKRLATGVFNVFAIAKEIFSEVAGLAGDLWDALVPDNAGGGIMSFLGDFGDTLTDLKTALVDDGGIADFFDKIRDAIKDPLGALEDLKDALLGFFDGLTGGGTSDALGVVGDGLDRLQDRFEGLKGLIERLTDIWDGFKDAVQPVVDVLGDVWDAISDWFSNLGSKIAEIFAPSDFDAAVDIVNVGLLGGIAAVLAKFLKDGIPFDFGNGLLGNISEMVEELTGTMEAMQTKLKAEALKEIAIAIGIIAASLLVLSLIDSAALTRALVAMSVGFGQLVAAVAVLNKLALNPAKLTGTATALVVLAGALLVMSVAVKILSTMSWEELARGMSAVVVLLGALSAAVRIMSANTGGMVRAGLGILLIAGAMNLLAVSMKIFATMNWEEIGKGLTGVAGGLGLIVIAMNLLPKGMATKAAGVLLVAVALNALGSAMKIIATLSWEEIGKGLVGIAGGLLLIAGAMHLMPLTLPVTAAGLILVGVALNAIALAVRQFGGMSWEELGRGLAGLAGSLLILGVAMYAMTGALPGAIALTVVSAALLLLSQALIQIGQLSIGELITGLAGIAGVLLILGLAAAVLSPVIPALMGLGVALILVGAGFALFGAGALLVAKSIDILAKLGGKAVSAFLGALSSIAKALPGIIAEFILGFDEIIVALQQITPKLIELVRVVVAELLTLIIELTPQIVETVITVISGLLEAVRELFPDFVETGYTLLLEMLRGIRDNINEIVTLGAEILTEFIKGLTENIADVVGAGAEFVAELIRGIGEAYGDIVTAGAEAVIQFLAGIAENALMVVDAAFGIIIDFINGLATTIENRRGELKAAGINLIGAILGGIDEKVVEIWNFFTAFPGTVLEKIGDTASTLLGKGRDLIAGLATGAANRFRSLGTWMGTLLGSLVRRFGSSLMSLWNAGRDLLQGLWNGMKSMKDSIWNWASDFGQGVIDKITKPWEWFSPSRVMKRAGRDLLLGMEIGMAKESPMALRQAGQFGQDVIDQLQPDPKDLTEAMTRTVSGAMKALSEMDGIDHSPTIRPVLDLSNVQSGARTIRSLFTDDILTQAGEIAATEIGGDDADATTAGDGSVVFNQTINAPEQLSTADIYRQTRNQIQIAKEELKIPS